MANKTNRAVCKLIEELNKLKAQVNDDVWAEICKTIKVISQKGYTLPRDEDFAEMAGRIRKEAETFVKDRIIFAPYENMGFGELTLAWQNIPEIKNEFNNDWMFINYIAKIFPISPARELARRSRPADYPKKQTGKQKNDEQTTSGDKAWGTTQATPETTKQKAKSVRDLVFIGYSHKDKKWLDDLQIHLKPYVRNGLTAWSDKKIAPGSKWLPEIETALASAKVAVLLVTPNFLASDFIHEKELGPLLKKAEKGKVKIIWIPVRACAYKETLLEDYQAAGDPEKPLEIMKANRNKAWVKICEEIKKTVSSSLA